MMASSVTRSRLGQTGVRPHSDGPGGRRTSLTRKKSNPSKTDTATTKAKVMLVLSYGQICRAGKTMKTKLSILLLLVCCTSFRFDAFAQTPDRQFIRTDARVVA